MSRYDLILFDLDGTLIDSGEGVVNSVCYALEQMGLPIPENRRELTCFVGPPLSLSFSTLYHLSPQDVDEAIRQYRVYYTPKGMWQCSIYPGVIPLLKKLRRAGKRLMVATCKPEQFAVPLLEKLGLAQEFDLIAGALADSGERSEKHQVIEYGLAQLGITDPSRVVMVGDRKYDVEGATRVGIPTVGVLYGFGDREELLAAGALDLAETPEDVYHLLAE